MEIVHDVLLFLHLLGMGSLFGGLLVQVRAEKPVVNSAMLHGVLTQAVTGLLLVGVLEAGDEHVNNAKIGVKFVLALVLAVLIIANRRKTEISRSLFWALLGTTVVTVGVAVFW